MLADPHFRARESIVSVPHATLHNLKMQNVFPKLSVTAGSIRWPGPDLGAHNQEIYGQMLGLSAREIEDLEQAGIV